MWLVLFVDISLVLQNSSKCRGRIPNRFFFSRDSPFRSHPCTSFRSDTSIACECLHAATLPTPASPRTTLLIGAVRRRRYPRNGEGDGITGDGDSTRDDGGSDGDGNDNRSATVENHFAIVVDSFNSLPLPHPFTIPKLDWAYFW